MVQGFEYDPHERFAETKVSGLSVKEEPSPIRTVRMTPSGFTSVFNYTINGDILRTCPTTYKPLNNEPFRALRILLSSSRSASKSAPPCKLVPRQRPTRDVTELFVQLGVILLVHEPSH